MTIIIVILVLLVAAGVALFVYKSKHPAGYAEHKQEIKDAADAVKKPFKK